MQRIRTVKPEFFKHDELYQAEIDFCLPLRVAYAGLWTCCDREGRFKWKPRQLKVDVLPYDQCDFDLVLDALLERGFVKSYEVDGVLYGYVPSFLDHQSINQREAASVFPSPESDNVTHVHARARTANEYRGVNVAKPTRETVFARDGHKCVRCGAVHDLTIDHIFPQCIGGTHALENLRTLCRSCNSARPVQGDALIADLAIDGLLLSDMSRICMHVHTYGEGKGMEGNGREWNGKELSAAMRSDSQTAKPQTLSPAATPLATKKVDDHIGVAWLVEKGVDEQAATDWLKVRKTKRAPLTLSAWKLLVTEAEKAGITPAEAVKIAAEKSWQSFVAEYLQNSKPAQGKTNALQFTTTDYNRGINADGSF